MGWGILVPQKAGAVVTNYFGFPNTIAGAPLGPIYPTNGATVFFGTNLNAGDLIIFDGIISDVPGSGPDSWGAVELNPGGGYLGVVNATLGLLAETGTSSGNPCQLFLNGASTSTRLGIAQGSRTNRVFIQLVCVKNGSTTNMNYFVGIDQGATGRFSASLSGAGLTFAGNRITLGFGANTDSHQFVQTMPVYAIAGATTVAAGAAATLTAALAQGFQGAISPQWLSNGIPIVGATSLTYVTPVLTAAATGAQYGVSGSNQFTFFASPPVTVSIRTVPGLVPFDFNTTAIANDTQIATLAPPSIIYGAQLLAGDTVVFDAVLSTNGPFASSDGWVSINLAAGGFEGVTTAQLGFLVRLGSGASQLFVNGSAYGTNPSSNGALTNRARIELFPSQTGSTTNMGWLVQLDQNLTGTFLPAVSGTNLTFPGNVIPLSLSAYDVPGQVIPLPVGLLAFHQVLAATNIPLGAFDQVTATEDFLNQSNVVVPASTPGLAYSSSNPQVITVSPSGYLQTVGLGQATITTSLGTLSDSNVVSVVDAGALESLAVAPPGPVLLNTNVQLTVTGTFANLAGVNMLRYGLTTFICSNTNVLTVGPNGIITPLAPGTSTITAVNGPVTSPPVSVTVVFPPNAFIYDTFNDGFWTIVNKANGNSLVVSAAGASQFTATNGPLDAQFEILYNLQNSSFRLLNRTNELCLVASGNNILPANYTGTAAGQWYLVSLGGGFYRIVNGQTGLAMQTDNGNPAHVTLVSASASPSQAWKMVYQTHYPKKGIAGYEQDFRDLELAWAYNYNDNTGVALPNSVGFAPMIHDASWEPLSDVQARTPGWLAQTPPDYLLTYNEPDNASQANMSTNQVIGLWPALEALQLPLVGPSEQTTLGSWENNYYSLMAANNYRVDYSAVHEYVPPNAASLIADCQAVYNAYGRPVWLTEFSPVDWSGCKCWSENDDYNFLAEFMWQAESQSWLRRYAIFPFSGTNSSPPWVDNGYSGTFFLADGATLSPYGELFATWDADMGLDRRTPYILHNLATSFRLTVTNGSSALLASDIYVRNARTEWGLLPAPATNHWYIISLNDGRRLRDSSGNLNLAAYGTTGAAVEWEFNGPDSSGYYFITNTAGHCLNSAGTDPAVTFNLLSGTTQNNNTRWRLVKAYHPVTTVDTVPAGVAFNFTNQGIFLGWRSGSNLFYNVYRSPSNGGPYTLVAQVSTTNYLDTTASSASAPYYYVITGLNAFGDESANSVQMAATVAAAWRQQWFGTIANAGNAADTANPAGDGTINVLKRAFGLNPLVAETNGVPYGSAHSGTFRLVYQQNLAATDLIFEVQSSPDLINWSSTNISDVVVSTAGGIAIHNASVPITANEQFLRVLILTTP